MKSTRLPGPTPPATERSFMCGCGLSRTFPLCDGNQLIAKTQHAGALSRCGAGTQAAPATAQSLPLEGAVA